MKKLSAEEQKANDRKEAVMAEVIKQYGEDAPFAIATSDGFIIAGREYEVRGLVENLREYCIDKLSHTQRGGIEIGAIPMPKELMEQILDDTDCGDPNCEVHGKGHRHEQ